MFVWIFNKSHELIPDLVKGECDIENTANWIYGRWWTKYSDVEIVTTGITDFRLTVKRGSFEEGKFCIRISWSMSDT